MRQAGLGQIAVVIGEIIDDGKVITAARDDKAMCAVVIGLIAIYCKAVAVLLLGLAYLGMQADCAQSCWLSIR